MIPLTIYKASAGSGKTFTLAVEYIKLLIDNPYAYRNILAVTFTVKATHEMKERILSQLYGLSKRLPSSKSYMRTIVKSTGYDEDFISRRAAMALDLLIHNYSYFQIATIDAFFQRVLGNLSRELDLAPTMKLEIDSDDLIDKAVDNLLESLGEKRRGNNLFNDVFSIFSKQMDEDKRWNIVENIKKFAKNIANDVYKERSDAFETLAKDKDFFNGFAAKLSAMQAQLIEEMQTLCQSFFDTLSSNSLVVKDLKGSATKGIAGYFLKLKKGDYSESLTQPKYFKPSLADPEEWVKSNSEKHDLIVGLAESVFIRLIHQIEAKRTLYRTADEVLGNLNVLGLLTNIDEEMNLILRERGMFLLANTQHVLSRMIGKSDTPFVFEKIGGKIEHLMIDEFQDTSQVQWHNFKILLQECMSREVEWSGEQKNNKLIGNLIVGDVKQSIYRFRSSDWHLLNNLTGEFKGLENEIQTLPLVDNHRSLARVVEFNNKFFLSAVEMEYDRLKNYEQREAQELKDAYSDVVQNVTQDGEPQGSVRVLVLSSDKADKYRQRYFLAIEQYVRDLLSHGVELKKIAVLTRSRSTVREIVQHFQETASDLPFISNEAFQLEASKAVMIIIFAMRCIADRKDCVSLAALAKHYQWYALGRKDINDAMLFISQDEEDRAASRYLPKEFTEKIETLAEKPLLELFETLYSIFEVGNISQESAYICTLRDYISKFAQDNNADLKCFLDEWDEHVHKKTIESDEVNGISIMTIHKSKGLEFDNVILPIDNWVIMPKEKDYMWCEPQVEPFDELPVIPVHPSEKQLKTTLFEDRFNDEMVQCGVDNLNLLYVTFTRAAKNLFVIAHESSYNKDGSLSVTSLKSRSNIVFQTMKGLSTALEGLTEEDYLIDNLETGDQQVAGTVYEYGSRWYGDEAREDGNSRQTNANAKKDKKTEENVFLLDKEPLNIVMSHELSEVTFRQSNSSKRFVADLEKEQRMSEADEATVNGSKEVDEKPKADNNAAEKAETETQNKTDYVMIGNLMHEILSRIETTDDVNRVLQSLEFSGMINSSDDQYQRLMRLLRIRLSDEKVKRWFTGGYTLFNECNILFRNKKTGAGTIRRPDRVMCFPEETVVVDFKFARPRAEHIEQVKQYVRLLKAMQKRPVKGCLWYVYTNEIMEVRDI